MTFLNDLIEHSATKKGEVPPALSQFGSVKPFVFDDNAFEIVRHLAQQDLETRHALVKAAQKNLFWPAGNTWMEWSYKTARGYRIRNGVMFSNMELGNETEIRRGVVQVYMTRQDKVDLDNGLVMFGGQSNLGDVSIPEPIWVRQVTKDVGRVIHQARGPTAVFKAYQKLYENPIDDDERTAHEALIEIIYAALALISTHRMVNFVQTDYSRLNNRRQKRGKWPLLSYSTVKVKLPRETIDAVCGPTTGEQRPLHFVRAYLRLKQGQVELVTPHWRGNAELGIVQPKYEVTG